LQQKINIGKLFIQFGAIVIEIAYLIRDGILNNHILVNIEGNTQSL